MLRYILEKGEENVCHIFLYAKCFVDIRSFITFLSIVISFSFYSRLDGTNLQGLGSSFLGLNILNMCLLQNLKLSHIFIIRRLNCTWFLMIASILITNEECISCWEICCEGAHALPYPQTFAESGYNNPHSPTKPAHSRLLQTCHKHNEICNQCP